MAGTEVPQRHTASLSFGTATSPATATADDAGRLRRRDHRGLFAESAIEALGGGIKVFLWFEGKLMTLEEALKLLLSHVDYVDGACRFTDAIGDVLPEDVLEACRTSLEDNRRAELLKVLMESPKPACSASRKLKPGFVWSAADAG